MSISTTEPVKETNQVRAEKVLFSAVNVPGCSKSVHIIVPSGRKYPLSGHCSLQVLAGSVRVLEYSISDTSGSVDVCAPLSSNQLLIEADRGVTANEIDSKWPAFSDFVKKFPPGFTFTIFCLDSGGNKRNVYEFVESAALLEKRTLKPFISESASSASHFIFDIAGVVFGVEDRPSVEFWPELSSAISSIKKSSVRHNVETNETTSRPLVVMVCGEKNAGKSTTCRAIINSLLSLNEFKEKGVGYLECDVGQTEFTPSTILSWSNIKHGLLEPPFMHMKAETSNPSSCVASFYGDLSPGQSPNRYFDCLKSVYSRIPNYAQKNLPLIVNTMGWMKSLGLALLVDTYRLVKPDIVLHLRTAQDTSPQLSHAFFLSADGINYSGPVPGDKYLPHELYDVAIQRRPLHAKNICGLTPPPFFLRTLSTLGHLAPTSDAKLSDFSNLAKCVIPIDSTGTQKYLFAGICHERVPSSETMRALLGSIVALCHVDVKLPTNGTVSNFLLTLPSGWIGNEWLGLGIVLDIDETNRKVTIATPLVDQPDVLARANCLMRGSVTITESSMAQIVPMHLRQNLGPPGLQVNHNNANNEHDDGSFDAQRFGGRRDFMRRKRGMPIGNSSNATASQLYRSSKY